MPVHVRLPRLLREPGTAGGSDGGQFDLDAASVQDLVSALDRRRPGMADALLDESGLRRYWCIHVNGRSCRLLDGLATVLPDGAQVWILPATSGGMFAPTVPTAAATP